MTTKADIVEGYGQLNTTSYATTVPTLALFTGVFVRILEQEDRKKFLSLIIICVLMIVN
jgi:hypothetical protein